MLKTCHTAQLRTLSDGENMPTDQVSVRQTQPFYSKGRKWAQQAWSILKNFFKSKSKLIESKFSELKSKSVFIESVF
jgi:hypothetical protein